MRINALVTIEVDEAFYAEKIGVPVSEAGGNIADEFNRMGDGLTWSVVESRVVESIAENHPDVVQTILARSKTGSGGGIPLSLGEVAMLFMDGHAGDGPGLLDIRSQGYGVDDDWDGLTHDDIFSCDEGEDAAFVWTKWEPLELWRG